MFVIGHELGHVKSNHMLYHMMAQSIPMLVRLIDSIPCSEIAAIPIQLALYYWYRMSELTADRAGLLCCQNKDAAIRALVKMAGMPVKQFTNMDCKAFIRQAQDFKQLDFDDMNKIIKLISIATDSHPWTVMRAAELLKWIESGDYESFAPDLSMQTVLNVINPTIQGMPNGAKSRNEEDKRPFHLRHPEFNLKPISEFDTSIFLGFWFRYPDYVEEQPYKDAESLYLYCVRNEKFGMIHVYEEKRVEEQWFGLVKKEKKYCWAKRIIPCKYDRIDKYDEYFMCYKGAEVVYRDLKGHVLK